jgi:hypothetical protein
MYEVHASHEAKVKWAVLALSLLFAGCHQCMQTRPSCSLEPYAIIEMVNLTNTHKMSYVQRYYDNKPLGDLETFALRPMTHYRYRVPPGIYEFGVKVKAGLYAWRTKDSLGACEVVTVNVGKKIRDKTSLLEKEASKLKSRRSIQ